MKPKKNNSKGYDNVHLGYTQIRHSELIDDNLRQLLNNLIIELYKYQAEDERKYILETQKQGIKLAKAKGKYKGGKPKYQENDPRLQLAFKLFLEGSTDKEVEQIIYHLFKRSV
ncbi:hypothetical protein K5E_21600 [Enterococcus thailandicus]|nr:hypothetical protein K4E_00050 [Enterococcus thailandicus]GMC10021.1 hypothetical protein K5E_21600 [Enterococcus thailandicus]